MSINQYNMNSLLYNQKIGKRRYFDVAVPAGNSQMTSVIRDSSLRTSVLSDKPLKVLTAKDLSVRESGRKRPEKAAFRPAGMIALFEQNSRLIEKVRQEPVKVHRRKPIRITLKQTQDSAEDAQEKKINGRRAPSFAVPFIPVSALFLLVLGFLFVVQRQGGLAWMDRQVVNFEDNSNSRQNLALYAGVSQSLNYEQSSSEEAGDAIPLDLTEAFAWHNYRVRRGYTVSQLAANFSVSMDAIIASNGITNARSLREGETIRIPNMDGIPYIVKDGDSLSLISQSMGVPLEAILDANEIQSDIISAGMTLFVPGARMDRQELRMALGELFIYPVRGARLTSPFGWRNDPISGVRRHHAAIDLGAPQGTPIRAAMEGRVSALGYNNTYGNFIILSHPGNHQTLYAHLHTVSVRRGDQVRQGAQIGTVGNTGYSTGPHLHFAIYKNGRAVNPLDFLGSQR